MTTNDIAQVLYGVTAIFMLIVSDELEEGSPIIAGALDNVCLRL